MFPKEQNYINSTNKNFGNTTTDRRIEHITSIITLSALRNGNPLKIQYRDFSFSFNVSLGFDRHAATKICFYWIP